jgi:MurNAc alpha-1-phosphate uridylyltransferase
VKAMILAAGLGQRMRPLTDFLPKPMLEAGGKPLLQYHLEALQRAGVTNVVINLAYLGEKIRAFVGDGSRFGLRVQYSVEAEPLETGGGISQALPFLGDEPFLLINGDVWSDYDFTQLVTRKLHRDAMGHLVMVPNPSFHPQGDFMLTEAGWLSENVGLTLPCYTFSGLSVLCPQLIADYPQRREKFPLAEVLRAAINRNALSGEVYCGNWSDVGTPERLTALSQMLDADQVSILKS